MYTLMWDCDGGGRRLHTGVLSRYVWNFFTFCSILVCTETDLKINSILKQNKVETKKLSWTSHFLLAANLFLCPFAEKISSKELPVLTRCLYFPSSHFSWIYSHQAFAFTIPPKYGKFSVLMLPEIWAAVVTVIISSFLIDLLYLVSGTSIFNVPLLSCGPHWRLSVLSSVFGLLLCFFFFFFGLFRATPVASGGSQARGLIRAVAADLHHSHSNTGSEPCLWPTPQLTERGQGSNPQPHGSYWIGFNSAVPRRELPLVYFSASTLTFLVSTSRLKALNTIDNQECLKKQNKQTKNPGVPVVVSGKWTGLASMRTQVRSLASLSGLRILCCREL